MPGINPDPHYTTPQAAKLSAPTSPLSFFYRGTSMTPIFKPGDCLSVMPVPLDQVRIGDVIVYRVRKDEDQDAQVVHRVIVKKPTGLGTRGDSNSSPDPGLVTAQNLLGVVVSYERSKKYHRVLGGRWGLFQWRFYLWLRNLARLVIILGRPLYRWLRRSKLVRRIWQPEFTRVRVETVHGPMVKYIQ
jgi:signal peptidase I